MQTILAWFRFQADTGLQAAYTDPINPIFNAVSPQPLYSFAAGYTHVFSQNLVNYFNPAFSWYSEPVRPTEPSANTRCVSDRPPRQRRQRTIHNRSVASITPGLREDAQVAFSLMTTSLGAMEHMSFASAPTPESSD